MQKIVHKLPLAAVIVSASLLAACGGGGGGSTSGTTSSDSSVPTAAEVVITEANKNQVAAATVDSVTSGGTNVLGMTAFGVEINSTTQAADTSMANVIAQIRKIKLTPSSNNLPVGVEVNNETQNCYSSGTMTVSGRITNEDDLFATAGDYANITFNNCNHGNGSTFNGSLSLTVNSSAPSQRVATIQMTNYSMNNEATGSSPAQSFSTPNLAMNVTLNGGQINYDYGTYFEAAQTTTSITGQFTFISSGVTRTLAANQLVEVFRDGSLALDGTYRQQGYDNRYTINGLMRYSKNGVSLGAGTYTTLTPFDTINYGNYPSTGQATFKGATGTLRVTAQSDATNVLIELDANDDGIYESTNSMTWTDLLASF